MEKAANTKLVCEGDKVNIRKIHINEQVWEYSIGQSHVPVWSPDGVKSVIEIKRLPGYLKWLEEQENSLGFSDAFRITPGKIKTYIEQVIMK